MKHLWLQHVRTRLTLWYVGTLAAVLALYLAGVSLLLVWQMDGVLKKLAAEDLETVKGLLYFQPDGKIGVREDYHHHTDWKQVQERFLEILAPDGAVLYRNARLGNRALGGQPFAAEDVWSKLLRYAGHWALLGFGYWAIEEKSSGRFVGEAGFADFKRAIEPSFDVEHHGRNRNLVGTQAG